MGAVSSALTMVTFPSAITVVSMVSFFPLPS